MPQPTPQPVDLQSMNSNILAFDLAFAAGFDSDELDRRLEAGLHALGASIDSLGGDACFNYSCTGYWPGNL